MKERLTSRTCDIIKRGRIIVLKKGPWYLHQHTSIPSGLDGAKWGWRASAMEFDNLEWAFAIAPLYGATVFSVKI